MEHWVNVVTVQDWIDQCATFLLQLPVTVVVIMLALSAVLAIISRQWAVITGCAILLLSAFLVFISPSKVLPIIGTGLYVGSVLWAVSAILAGRKAKSFEIEQATLRSQVDDLLAAEQRRLLRDIRSSSKERASSSPKNKNQKNRTTET
jgi:hypothetical protein